MVSCSVRGATGFIKKVEIPTCEAFFSNIADINAVHATTGMREVF
jgi:hypothetical protein